MCFLCSLSQIKAACFQASGPIDSCKRSLCACNGDLQIKLCDTSPCRSSNFMTILLQSPVFSSAGGAAACACCRHKLSKPFAPAYWTSSRFRCCPPANPNRAAPWHDDASAAHPHDASPWLWHDDAAPTRCSRLMPSLFRGCDFHSAAQAIKPSV